jgi:hypothetical protein
VRCVHADHHRCSHIICEDKADEPYRHGGPPK